MADTFDFNSLTVNGGTSTWGFIDGFIENQLDLMAKLGIKQDKNITFNGVNMTVYEALEFIYEKANSKLAIYVVDNLPTTCEANSQYWVKVVDKDERNIYITDSVGTPTFIGKSNEASLTGYVKKTDLELNPVEDATETADKIKYDGVVYSMSAKDRVSVGNIEGCKMWKGTEKEYEEITNKDDATVYLVEGDNLSIKVDENPIGSIIAFGGTSTPPSNYLLCDGREVSRADYRDLFLVIGETYGSGDGTTTFNLPNLKDKFLQGLGDLHTQVGQSISEELPNIKGTAKLVGLARRDWNHQYAGAFASSSEQTASEGLSAGTFAGAAPDLDFDASKSNSIYKDNAHVQPNSVIVNYYIKAKRVYTEFQNVCPHEVGAVAEFLDSTVDPNTLYAGTVWEQLTKREEYDDNSLSIAFSISVTVKYARSFYLGNNLWAYQAWYQCNQSVGSGIIQIGNMQFKGVNKSIKEQQLTGANGWTPECYAINNGAFYKCGSGTFVSGTNIHIGGTVYVNDTTPDRIFYRWKRKS